MQALLERLMTNYRQDIVDLEVHFHRAEEFEKLLIQENAKTPSHKRNAFFTSKTEKNAEQEVGYDLVDKQLSDFAKKRTQQFMVLQQRGNESAKLREKIGYLSGTQMEELNELSKLSRETMTKMLELDHKVMELLKMEIGAVKLELHRMQTGAKSKKVYQNQAYQEARFIDKVK